MKKMLWFPILFLVFSATTPTSAQDDEVILNPGTLSGSVSIAGHRITSITVYAIDTVKLYSATATVNVQTPADNIDYVLTVEGDRDYYVMARATVSGAGTVRAFLPVIGPFNVPIGSDVPADMSMNPATISGTISTGSSGNTIQSYSINAYISVPEFDDPPYYNYASMSSLNAPGDTGVQYALLVAPGVEYYTYAYVGVDGLSYRFYDSRTTAPAAGEVMTRDYTVDVTTASISGTALLQGMDVSRVQMYGYASSPYRSNSCAIPEVGSGLYTLNVDAGTWRLYPRFWFDLPGDLSDLSGSLELPYSDGIEVQAGDQLADVDFTVNPGFIGGTLNLWGANTDFSSASVGAQTNYGGGYVYSDVDPETNRFMFVCSPDDWHTDYYQYLSFDYPNESDPSLRSTVYQRQYNSTDLRTVEAGQVAPNVTLTYGTITVRRYFYVAGGGMLRSPSIRATRWESPYSEASGYGSSALTDEGQAIVTLLLPGTYTVEAFAYVDGSNTEFSAVDITVDEGDVVVIGGTGRPTTQITNPTNGQIISGDTVTVQGTVSDDCGIASITVNGQAVAFDPTANPVQFSCQVGLDPGENTITIVVADVDETDPVVVTLTVYRQTEGYTLNITSSDGGSVTTPGEGSFSYDSGTSVDIQADPNDGYVFTGWTGTAVTAGKVADPDAPQTTVTVDGTYTLQANFHNDEYTISFASTEGGGAELWAQYELAWPAWLAPQTLTFDGGTDLLLKATPEAGYRFSHWSGTIYSTAVYLFFSIDQDHNIVANFVPSKDDDPGTGQIDYELLRPVYRFWSPVTGRHFYTISRTERDRLRCLFADVWTYEKIAFCAFEADTVPGTSPVYRFWSDRLQSHVYTMDKAEKNKLIKDCRWAYEGVAFYAFATGDQPDDAYPVYRFWSDKLQSHFYTIDERERDKLILQFPKTWTYKGIVWYAYK